MIEKHKYHIKGTETLYKRQHLVQILFKHLCNPITHCLNYQFYTKLLICEIERTLLQSA